MGASSTSMAAATSSHGTDLPPPRSAAEISDRRNELSGNLPLHQELHFIE